MTVVARTSRPPSGTIALGSRSFIVVVSLCIAVTALGVDTILPAFDSIRAGLGLDPEANEVTALVTAYLAGGSAGLLPAGLLADRYGRRMVIWGGLAIYVIGALATVLAPSLGFMVAARFVWGLGSAGPRVSALAMIRDGFSGEQMARQMSFVMAVFMLVPAVGPALAAGILTFASWQAVVGLCAVVGVGVATLVVWLPETLTDEARRPLEATAIIDSYRIVLRTPGTVWYLATLTALFGVFYSYLSTSELILDQAYGLSEWFPLFFGGLALVMLVAMLVNGRTVERLGLTRLLTIGFAASIAASLALFVVAIVSDGAPPFWLFVVVMGAVLFTQQLLIPNVNSSAMIPLAAVAGTGAAVLNMVSGVVGSLLAEAINRRFEGTITPLAFGFVASSIVAAGACFMAVRRSPPRTFEPVVRPTSRR